MLLLLLLCHLLIAPHRPTRCRRRSAVWRAWCHLFCADMKPEKRLYRVQSDCWNGMLINMTLTFLRTNDSHRNARNYRIDSQTPENTSHFAMRITLFPSLVGTHIHYHAKFHADRCHRRRYIFNRGEKKPANLVPCHTNVTYLWLVISKLQLKFGLKWLFERAWLMEGAYENLWKSGRFCLLIAWWIDSCCATLYNKHLLWLGGCHVRVLCRNS